MPFAVNNTESKQFISLSVNAYCVLLADEFSYSEEKRAASGRLGSGYLNRVIQMYYKQAEATVGLRLQSLLVQAGEAVMSLRGGVSEITKAELLEKLRQRYTEELLAQMPRRGAGQKKSTLIRLNKRTLQLLTDEYIGCTSEFYKPKNSTRKDGANSPCKYLAALLEEYAGLPKSSRERIYFGDSAAAIEDAISRRSSIRCTYRGAVVTLMPLALCHDEWGTYNYVVGMQSGRDAPANFRLCYMRDIDIPMVTEHISGYDTDRLIEEMSQKGVMFVGGESGSFEVRLTERGYRMYNSMGYLRPACVECTAESDDSGQMTYLCRFRCTADQIRFYFFKYGADAEVVAPASLRSEFAQRYEEALRRYAE